MINLNHFLFLMRFFFFNSSVCLVFNFRGFVPKDFSRVCPKKKIIGVVPSMVCPPRICPPRVYPSRVCRSAGFSQVSSSFGQI